MLIFCFYTFLMLLCCWRCLFGLSLALGVGYCCCFCHAILFAQPLFLHYSYTLLVVTLPFLSWLLLTLLILSCYHSSHVVTLFALFFLPFYSSHVAIFEMSHLSHFMRLLGNLCCSSRTTILDPFALLLLCFVWLVSYFPCHVHVRAQRSDTNSNTKCEFFCIFSIFLSFYYYCCFVFYFLFCCFFVVTLAFLLFVFPSSFVLFLFSIYQFYNSCASLFFMQNFKNLNINYNVFHTKTPYFPTLKSLIVF